MTKDVQNPKPTGSSILVGYRCKPRSDYQQSLEALTPPKSYRKQETIDEWLAAKQELFTLQARNLKITGEIAAIFAVDLSAGKIFDTSKLEKDGPWGIAFARWLLDTRGYRSLFADQPKSGSSGVNFYGFDLKPFLRVLGVECNTAGFEVPLGLWYGNDDCYDPYEMLVESGNDKLFRKLFPLAKVLERGGLKLKGYRPGLQPQNDTKVVAELVSRFGLIPSMDVAGVRSMLEAKAFTTQALETDATPLAEEPEAAEEPAESATRAPKKARRKKRPARSE
jgi:hypothetical protein